jgi:hypothetical protein
MESQPTLHFWLNFLLRSNVYSNMHPCVAALEKRSSNGWFMRTKFQIIEEVTCQAAAESLVCLMPRFSTKEQTCTASDHNHDHLIWLLSTVHSEVSARLPATLALDRVTLLE